MINELVTPAIVSAIVTGLLVPLAFYVLKRRDARQQRRFDIRYEQYQRFLTKLDEIAESSRTAFHSEFGPLLSAVFTRILRGEGTESALLELNDGLQSLTTRIQTAYLEAKGELNGMRLVCSDDLFPLVQEFMDIQERQFHRAVDLMGRWRELTPEQLTGSIPVEAETDGERTKVLQNEILKQMRTELKLG